MEFIHYKTNSFQYGAIMHFRTLEDLDNYKSKESGTYQTLVRSIRETWTDDTKPVNEQVFEIRYLIADQLYHVYGRGSRNSCS